MGKRFIQARRACVKIMRQHPEGMTVPEILDKLTLRNIPSGKELGQILSSTPGISVLGKMRLGGLTSENPSDYTVYGLTDEQAWNRWSGGD